MTGDRRTNTPDAAANTEDKVLVNAPYGRLTCDLPASFDAGLYFIGSIRTPWEKQGECPRHGDFRGPVCCLEIDELWRPALSGLERYEFVEVLYYMHLSPRNFLVQAPRGKTGHFGTFALRSPVRPNPIATSIVRLMAIEPSGLIVRGLDCVDGTPLIDIKPHEREGGGDGDGKSGLSV
jgi:tRNA (adenine37-N6)-methyltransferase